MGLFPRAGRAGNGRLKIGNLQLEARGAFALLLGATGIGMAAIFVRLSEIGPVATGFYRILLALPFLWWALLRASPRQARAGSKRDLLLAALGGVCFAADLGLWHWALKLSSVASATLLANLSPFFVIVGARFVFGEQVSRRLMAGMVIAFAGGFLLVSESLNLDRRNLWGDLLAVGAAIFYAGYLLVVKRLREARSAWFVMAWTGIFCAPAMFLGSWIIGENMAPQTVRGWAILMGLALISHVGGQGMIAYGLAHAPASVSAVLLMWQPVVSALLAWVLLGEALTVPRTIGGLIIIAGILTGTWRRSLQAGERAPDRD